RVPTSCGGIETPHVSIEIASADGLQARAKASNTRLVFTDDIADAPVGGCVRPCIVRHHRPGQPSISAGRRSALNAGPLAMSHKYTRLYPERRVLAPSPHGLRRSPGAILPTQGIEKQRGRSQSGRGMNSTSSPGTFGKRPSFQSRFACSIRDSELETK